MGRISLQRALPSLRLALHREKKLKITLNMLFKRKQTKDLVENPAVYFPECSMEVWGQESVCIPGGFFAG